MRGLFLTLLAAVLALSAPAAADPSHRRPAKARSVRQGHGRSGAARADRGARAPRGHGSRQAQRERNRARLAAYRASVVRWQTLGAGVRTTWREGMRDIAFHAVNTGETAVVRPFRPTGALEPEAVVTLQHLLRDQRAGADHPVDPRLVSVLYRLVDALDAPQINVISGFRRQRGRGHSLHGEGRAIDIIVPGVDSERVAEVARRLGHVGVGMYPTSGFVHVDVRDRSYFWVDRSGPGQRGRVVQVRADESRAADAAYDPSTDRIAPRVGVPDEAAPEVTVAAAPASTHHGRSDARHRRAARRPGKLRAGHR